MANKNKGKGIGVTLTNIIYALTKNADAVANLRNDDFLTRVKDSVEPIRAFCKKYKLLLTEVSCINEAGFTEPCYAFSDNQGYYTLDGILKSINCDEEKA